MLTSAQLDTFASQGYLVIDDFFEPSTIDGLRNQAIDLKQKNLLNSAKIGQLNALENAKIRADFTHWLEANTQLAPELAYWQNMQKIQSQLNRDLMLGLDYLEAHYAVYPIGGGYKKHLDQFSLSAKPNQKNSLQNNSLRIVSSVLYLNPNWQLDWGGQLRLYLENEADEFLDISPIQNRLVLFLSGEFWHEVLPAQAPRMSIAGWFRTRD